jgi:hypothetical protein
MLQKLGEHIRLCRERAEQCKAAAAAAADAMVQKQLMDLETQWRHVAKSYEFVESLERFLLDHQRNTLPLEVEKLPKDGPELEAE